MWQNFRIDEIICTTRKPAGTACKMVPAGFSKNQRDGEERERVEDADEQQLRQPEPVDVGAVRERAAGELQIRQSGQAGHQVL